MLRLPLPTFLGEDRAIDLPWRKPTSPTTTTPTATAVIPYLTASDAVGALAWYTQAFGAEEQFRVVGPDGLLGHAEFRIGDAVFYLSDEHPAMGVVSPTTLGGTPYALHLTVTDVDTMFQRAAAAGGATRDGEPYVDGIWGSMTYTDPDVGIRFVTEVLGFDELVLVRDDQGGIVHSEYRWPEGGIVQIAGAEDGNPFLPAPGGNGLYVITKDPHAVWERCRAAGVEVIREPEEPHYDPGGMGFSVRDREGNAWSFGSYTGGATE